jgi:hypothetical protein
VLQIGGGRGETAFELLGDVRDIVSKARVKAWQCGIK